MYLSVESAAGTPIQDLIPALIVGFVATVALAVFGWAHRTKRTRALERLAAFGVRISGLPGWAAVPSAIAGAALLTAVFGFYWDVATHIDNGRDPGIFANPSHYLIVAGLAGCALAGYVAILIGRDRTSVAVRIGPGWYAPIGGLLLFVCGGIAVMGFPLDDVWHRLFGQDVTLWSPTHVQMVGGASLSTLALWVLIVDGRREAPAARQPTLRALEMITAGSFLIGLSALQAEFDYSVPQFRLLFHPVLLMACAGTALVAARIRLGRGAALVAVLFFIVIRGVVSLLIGPVMGHTTLHFPLYIVEALAVEGVALKIGTKRQLTFGAACGVAIGTFGLAAEWLWSHIWMTMSWPASLGVEAIVAGVVAALAGSLLGAFIGRALLEPNAPRQAASRSLGIGVAVAVVLVLAYPYPTTGTSPAEATIRTTPVEGREGWVRLDVTLDPVDAADGSEWFVVSAWQGGGSVVDELEPLGNGRYRSRSVPVFGEWKTLLRLHDGRKLLAVPIYLPDDPVIPAKGTPVPKDGEVRPMMYDKKLLLREAKDVSFVVTSGASTVLALIALVWVLTVGWGLARIERPERRFRRPKLRSAVGSG